MAVSVYIEKIVSGGEGFARLADGRVVFVPGTLPEELADIKIVQNKKDYARGEVLRITKASPFRGVPPCPYYFECGGCDFQHITSEAQPQIKLSLFRETLARIGQINIEQLPAAISHDPSSVLHYRTRAQFHIDADRGRVGFLGKHSSRVVQIATCPILDPRLQNLLEEGRSNWMSKEFPNTGRVPSGDKRGRAHRQMSRENILTLPAVVSDSGA
ncbi:MAG: TRAM domain-containing protein, partial [Spirochaetales bacterium]|nr:TRAM domain-containing protein [Spirochaetales bacterium]